MADSVSMETVTALAEEVRALLRRADALRLSLPGIHLNAALLSLADLAPPGAIVLDDVFDD